MFYSGSSWNFDNDTDRSVDGSSSSHVENRKNSFLILGLGPTFGINGQFGSAKKFSISLTKQNTKFCLREIIKFKADKK